MAGVEEANEPMMDGEPVTIEARPNGLSRVVADVSTGTFHAVMKYLEGKNMSLSTFVGVALLELLTQFDRQDQEADKTQPFWDRVVLHETSRTYTYSGCEPIRLENVIELVVTNSGNHRIKTRDAHGRVKLHILAPGWVHIEIHDESEEWTV